MKRRKIEKRKIDPLSVIGISLFLLIIIFITANNIYNSLPNSFGIDLSKQISSDLVCMYNNVYLGKDQIKVPINNKIYFSCKVCEEKFKSDSTTRFSIDPLTGEKIDKAEAYIVLISKGSDDVQYFKSHENFEKFLKK